MIADRIKYFRALRRKTQVSLANEASIDYRHFQKLEAGQSDFKMSTIFKLSEALAIPACYLLHLDPFENSPKQDHLCPTDTLNQLQVGLVAWDQAGKIVFCNKQFSALIGMTSEIEVMKGLSIAELEPNGISSEKIAEYKKNVFEGKIKSDFVRIQIKLPQSNEVRTIFGIWNHVMGPRTGDSRGFVAAVWGERDCLDLTLLPGSSIQKIG